MKGDEYRDLIANYIHANFSPFGLVVYVEVPFGKTVIGKNRRVDVLALRPSDQQALGLECKYQASSGTTDEKIPYALQDLAAMWIPGALVYGGIGWSAGVLHTLEGDRRAVFCEPDDALERHKNRTIELDHIIASVFGLWDVVIDEKRRLVPDPQMSLPAPGFTRVSGSVRSKKPKTDATG